MSNAMRPGNAEGDPGKLAYLHNANWTPKLQTQLAVIDPRVCPGCLFPYAIRKHEHVADERCALYRRPVLGGDDATVNP